MQTGSLVVSSDHLVLARCGESGLWKRQAAHRLCHKPSCVKFLHGEQLEAANVRHAVRFSLQTEVLQIFLDEPEAAFFVQTSPGCQIAVFGGTDGGRFEGAYILKFSRMPSAFETALLRNEELQKWQSDLHSAGYKAKLNSGAKMFLPAALASDVFAAIDFEQVELRPWHVIVCPETEAIVRSIADELPCNDKVKLRSRSDCIQHYMNTKASYAINKKVVMRIGATPVAVRRTFIDVNSSSDNSMPVTVSTSDARQCHWKNPRVSQE